MVGFDHLLAKALNENVHKNLGAKTTAKIEDRLFEKFGLSLTQSIEEFEKFDLVLREFFGRGADGLEQKMFKDIIEIKSKKAKGNWQTITNPNITSMILEAVGDQEKKKILETTADTPKIVADIVKDVSIPQTSGYRKINSLINGGLLVQSGHIMKDNKKISKYVCIFNNLKINIEKNKVVVDIQLTQHEQQNSSILEIIQV